MWNYEGLASEASSIGVMIKAYRHHFHADIDECELGLHTEVCDEHAVCIDNEGSFTCRCVEPFFGDGRECRGMTLL